MPLGIDANDLKTRLAASREASSHAPRPRAAVAAEEVARTSTLHKSSMKANIGAIPVLGYLLRVTASAFNLPHIVANLQRHYASYHSEIRRLNLQIVELNHIVEQMQQRIDKLEAQPSPSDDTGRR